MGSIERIHPISLAHNLLKDLKVILSQWTVNGEMIPHKKDAAEMALLINSYSFVVLGLLILLIVAFLTWKLVNLQWAVLAVATTFACLGIFQSMASTETNTVSSPEDFNNALTSGKPVLLELYSDF